MKYRRKSVVVEAWRNASDPMPDWVADAVSALKNGRVEVISGGAIRVADRGDWLIRDSDGEVYPCGPNQFEATYEPVT